MAKSESTAVNALIDMVRSGKPAAPDAADDLFGAKPAPRAAGSRMTSTIPPMRGAGEVAPLPPTRAPTGTSQLHVGNQVRMTTAPPSRANTIPPLPQAKAGAKAPPPPHRASGSALPQPTPPRRASSPSPDAIVARSSAPQLPRPSAAQGTLPPATAPKATLPPPSAQRASSPGLPAPVRDAAKRTTGAQRTAPPSTTPVAAPFDANPLVAMPQFPVVARAQQTIDQTGDVVSAENWFEASRAVEKIDETWIGTRPAPRRRDHAATVKKAVIPLVALAVVGFGVGYLVFHSATTRHASAAKPATTHVTAPAPAPSPEATTAAAAAPSTESANAATATAGATQPEPPAPGAAPAASAASIGPADPNVPAHPNANDMKIVAKSSDETPAAAAPVAPAAPAPAAATPVAPAAVTAVAETAPVVHEVQTGRGAVKLVDVRIDSKPAGATVMLVDNGKTTFLGTTPVAASVDPGRSYDVVLTLEGRPTQMAHLDPSKTQRLDVALARAGKAAPAAPAVKAAEPKAETPKKAEAPKKKPEKHVAASAPTGGLVDPGFDAPPAAEKQGGSGTLMVSSKPPCEIWIDGKDTGLKTPQKSMALTAGGHKVTFVNTDEKITKTVSVKITADQSTKLIQDLMSK